MWNKIFTEFDYALVKAWEGGATKWETADSDIVRIFKTNFFVATRSGNVYDPETGVKFDISQAKQLSLYIEGQQWHTLPFEDIAQKLIEKLSGMTDKQQIASAELQIELLHNSMEFFVKDSRQDVLRLSHRQPPPSSDPK